MTTSLSLPSELSSWIYNNIQRPIAGFDQKKKANGVCYSYEEQLKATRYQIEVIACSYLREGKSFSEIIPRLKWFVD